MSLETSPVPLSNQPPGPVNPYFRPVPVSMPDAPFTVASIADPATADAEDVALKVNEIIAALAG